MYWRHFAKITFPPFFASHLEFYVECKNAFILKTVRDITVLMKFLTHRVSAECTGDIHKNRFATIFGGHLEYLRKMQKRIYLGNKILAAILNFGGN